PLLVRSSKRSSSAARGRLLLSQPMHRSTAAPPSLLTCLLVFATSLTAQSIQYDEGRKLWLFSNEQSSYAMEVGPQGELEHLYWGPPLPRIQDFPPAVPRPDISSFDPHQMLDNQEYPGWGGPLYEEPALKITRQDGDRDLVLRYVSHRIQQDDLEIELTDIRDPVEVTLHYRVYPRYSILRRYATIRNGTAQQLTIESAQSAAWYLPPGEGYRLTYLSGRWAGEDQINREPIHAGMKVLESRKGHTSHNLNPWFAIDAGDATEETGGVWFGGLAWSGNWRITIEQTPYQQVRITGGFNTFDFAYSLRPGEALDRPAFFAGFNTNGFGGASRAMHRFERDQIVPGGAKSRLRPVLYNSWEATEFNVNQAAQEGLADKATNLGVELFVMDDGWFGKRNSDRAGLGDWYVSPQKFPNGLKPLIDHVNGLGMDFGLWVEYVRNLYDIMDRLRAKHRELEIEGCSGGGGRIDLGILQRVDIIWTSDDTEAFDRLRIQEGFTQAYAPKLMSAWVTDVPNMNGRSTPLQFRFLVAMQGALGIGANLNRWS